MRIFAVLDTNVLVSALLKTDSAPSMVVNEAMSGCLIPLLDDSILAEYQDVLYRPKFRFNELRVYDVLNAIKRRGVRVDASPLDAEFNDPDDMVFYAVVMEKRKDGEAYLVTGNQKHFPQEPFIVTPREMMEIIIKNYDKMSEIPDEVTMAALNADVEDDM